MKRRVAVFLTISSLIAVIGCSSGTQAETMLRSINKTNIQRLTNLYYLYQSQNSWVGPADLAELREFVGTVSSSRLERIGVDIGNLDSLFISERDGQEFVMRPSVQGSPMGSVQPVIFEKEGVDGIWMVGFTTTGPREVTSRDEYDKMLNGQWQDDSANNRRDRAPGLGQQTDGS